MQAYCSKRGMLRRQANDFAGIFLVLLSGLVLTYRLGGRVDIMATDDDVYFQNGLLATWQHLPPVQMAPLFSGWYVLLNAFTHNVIDTYYLSGVVLAVLLGLLFYLLLRSLRVGVVVSVALAVAFLFSSLNLPLQPKVSLFTMLWLMAGLTVANHQTDPINKLTAAAIGALLAAYGRPEFFLSFLALGGLGLVLLVIYRRRRANAPLSWPLPSTLLAAAGLVLAFGSPLAGGRSIIAFGQHFALNYATWHPEIKASPWMHSATFIRHGFGRDVTSLADAFWLNPSLFLRHLTTNLTNLALSTGRYLADMLVTPWLSQLVFPGRRYLLMALTAGFLALTDWPQTGRNLWAGLRHNGWYWMCLLLMLAPTLVSCLLIFPREHYLVFQMTGYLSLLGVALRDLAFRPVWHVPVALRTGLATGFLLLFLWPKWQLANRTQPTPIADLLRSLQKLPVRGAVSMTGNEPLMYDLYLGINWRFWYLERYTPANMQAFMQQYTINCLHIRPDVVQRYKDDPYFNRLLAHPADLGFVRFNTGKPGQYVLIQNQLTTVASTSPHRARAVL